MTDIRQKLIEHFDSSYWGNIDGGADFEDMADEVLRLIADGAEDRLANGPFQGECYEMPKEIDDPFEGVFCYVDPDGNRLPLSEIVSAVLPISKSIT